MPYIEDRLTPSPAEKHEAVNPYISDLFFNFVGEKPLDQIVLAELAGEFLSMLMPILSDRYTAPYPIALGCDYLARL